MHKWLITSSLINYSSKTFIKTNKLHTGTVHNEEATGTASMTEMVKAAASITGGRVPNGVTVTSTGTVALLQQRNTERILDGLNKYNYKWILHTFDNAGIE